MASNLQLPNEPEWPGEAGRPTVLLTDASSKLEESLIYAWASRHGREYETIRIPPSRRRRAGIRPDPRLEARLGRGDDPLVIPVRIVWRAQERDDRRSVQLTDLLKFGDPRDPNAFRQQLFLRQFPDRCVIILGQPAGAQELRDAWRASDDVVALREFVSRRAWLTLERAERHLRGNRYKVPKFLTEEIIRKGEFRDGISQLATENEQPYQSVHKEAVSNLKEIAASHSPAVIDLAANLIHKLYRQGYGTINYDADRLNELYELGEQHPIVFLPSHKSQLDRLMLQFLLWENDRPPSHTAGGINMNFFPIGPVLRRSGVFFIRRTFKDKPIYKFALRSYIDFLIEKRFPLEWFLEGGRSRSGKMLPPKFGMLSYITDSYCRGKAEDIMLIPVSIAYDQIQDVADYAREQRGESKQGESFRWMLKAVSQLRRRYGNVYVRFGDPISMADALGSDASPDEKSIAVQKLAFEVMFQIGQVTPISATAAVCIALLSAPKTPRTVAEITESLTEIAMFVFNRHIPVAERVRLDGTGQVLEVLERLVEHDIVTRVTEGTETRYQIGDDQHLSAAYYRNAIIHYFVNAAITELALESIRSTEPEDPTEHFWTEAMAIRDLLKFEFFFAPKDEFRDKMASELRYLNDDWETALANGNADKLLEGRNMLMSRWALRPFIESYAVVAEQLTTHTGPLDEKSFLSNAVDLGQERLADGQVAAAESVSQVIFSTALELAKNRGLVGDRAAEHSDEALVRLRQEFFDEITNLLERIRRFDER